MTNQIKNSMWRTSKFGLPLVIIGIYLTLGSLLLPFYRYQINPDGITYISIAQKYLRGEFHDAINGHAYPMISWLLVPLLYVNIEPLLATKILNLLAGAVVIINLYLLTARFSLKAKTALALLAGAVPVLLHFAFYVITPDMLLTAVMLTYLLIVFKKDFAENWTDGILCGLVGGIAYLTKSFFLPFFYCHFPLMCAMRFFSRKGNGGKKLIIVNALAGIATCLVVSGLWVSTISAKYGHITASSQGSVVFSVISPHPHVQKGLVPPPNKTAISIWEDPSEALKGIGWNPFASYADLKYWMKVIIRNILNNTRFFAVFSPVALCLCLGFFLSFYRAPQHLKDHTIFVLSCITIIIYAGGYSLLLSDERFLWPLFLLYMLMSGYCLDMLAQKSFFVKKADLLRFILAISFLSIPVKNLYENFNTGKDIFLLSKKVSQHIAPKSKIASDTDWYRSLFLAYHLGAPLYGTADKLTKDELKSELGKYAIDYFLVWGDSTEGARFWEGHMRVDNADTGDLRIYRLR